MAQFKNVVPRQLAPPAVVFLLSFYVRLLLVDDGKTDAGPLVFFFKDYGFRELVPRKQAPNFSRVSTSKEA